MSIIITDLCKTFDDNEVLKNVNITLKDNSIYCLMGSSGIGKTTLLRILIGLERADSGSVSGIDTKSISCMFQEDRLIPYLSAIDNVRIVNPGESADTYQDVYDNNGNYAGLHATLWEQALYDAFGEHFLNTRLYLMENALSDCGLTPTENDIIDIQTGNLPEQIRADFTHFNSYGYYSKAKAIYLKGIELGYWN